MKYPVSFPYAALRIVFPLNETSSALGTRRTGIGNVFADDDLPTAYAAGKPPGNTIDRRLDGKIQKDGSAETPARIADDGQDIVYLTLAPRSTVYDDRLIGRYPSQFPFKNRSDDPVRNQFLPYMNDLVYAGTERGRLARDTPECAPDIDMCGMKDGLKKIRLRTFSASGRSEQDDCRNLRSVSHFIHMFFRSRSASSATDFTVPNMHTRIRKA